jgi:proteasome lid subunit RPN8/RPN11
MSHIEASNRKQALKVGVGFSLMAFIHKEILKQICVTAEQHYPKECCGLLIGKAGDIMEIRAAENVAKELMHRRYLIHPLELLAAENYVRGTGMEVLGVYHSHPDYPARPSEFDLENAVPHYLYMIVSVARGRSGEAACWRLDDCHSGFKPEELLLA